MNPESVYSLQKIGEIHSPFKQKFGTPRQSRLIPQVPGYVQFDPKRLSTGALEGLEGFSHVWLIVFFHLNRPLLNKGKIHPPRLQGKKQGVFASRSPHRPNPIGLSLVEVQSVDIANLRLHFIGHDLVDRTPLFDLKPFISTYDKPIKSRDGWHPLVKEALFDVIWSDEALQQSQLLQISKTDIELISQCLTNDVRSRHDRGKADKIYYWHFMDYDFKFCYQGQQLKILGIRRFTNDLDEPSANGLLKQTKP